MRSTGILPHIRVRALGRSAIGCGMALMLWIGAVAAQTQPQGRPQADAPVRDAEFGVSTRQFALQRRVEMYQWRKVGDAYVSAWSEQVLGSAGHDAAHRNPEALPLHSQEWRAQRITLDGKPLAAGVIDDLGVWRDLRPDFSALPGNLSATFQPEGDGLGSAENPLAPQIGDLRVTWRERALPALEGRVVLVGDAWALAPAEASNDAGPDANPDTKEPAPTAWFGRWWLLVLLAVAIVLLFVLRRRKVL